MRLGSLGLKDEERDEVEGEEEEQDEKETQMLGEDSMDVGTLPTPTQLVDPFAPFSSKATIPLVNTLGIPKIQGFSYWIISKREN